MEWQQVVNAVRRQSPVGAGLIESASPDYRDDTLVLTFHDRSTFLRLTGNQRGLAMVQQAVHRTAGLRLQCRFEAVVPLDPTAPAWPAVLRATDAQLKPLWPQYRCACGQDSDMALPGHSGLLWYCEACGWRLLTPLGIGAQYRSRWFGACRVEEVGDR